ncbi:MAG: choice-of-anchor J domain-containing protein, partial [Chitinophagales bacterium]
MRKIYFLLLTVFSFLFVTQKSFGQYCTVTFPTSIEPITLVNFNTINNSSSATVGGSPALEDFTAISTNVFKTVTYPIRVKGNTDGPFTTFVNVYVDWNQDLDFDDAGENFFIGTITNSTGLDAIEIAGNILIPAAALDGPTRMRVIKKYAAQAPPCNNAGFGQAEDYTLNIASLPPCVAPPAGGTAVGPAGIVCPGANFNVTITGGSFGLGTTYMWQSSPDNSAWTDIGITTAGLTTSTNTNTYYRRKISCSGSDDFSSSVLITVAAPLALPFTENFSTYTTLFPPSCWTRNNATFITGQAPSSFSLGVGSAKWDFYNAPSGTLLDLSTAVFTAAPANYRLTFDHAYASFSGEVDNLQILYSTDGGANYTLLTTYVGGSTGPLNTIGGSGNTTAIFSPTAAQWASKAIAIPAGTNRLMFRGVAGFGNNLFVDNIRVEVIPPCLPASGLSVGAMTPTSSVLNWVASPSNPSSGYEWEVRTSGAAGSGATGLVTSGATGAGVTTANATGLTPNTTYSYYVRANCGAGVFSSWTLAFVFSTPCNPIATPFTETFATYATTFPPTCWSRNNTTFLIGNAASAYGVGLGSAKFDFYNASSGTNLDLISPLFAPVPAGWRCTFDHAYATFFGEVDELQISYSTDGGGTYSPLITYLGGTAGPLNTAGAVLPAFTPTATQWLDKAVDLPVGTNRLRFRGVSAFGNNLYLDNIVVELTPSCLPVTNVKAQPVSPTSVIVSFTPPATTPTVGYIVEYGPVNFTPGTDNNPGAGGTIGAIGPASPLTVTGLTASTTYDFYVRKICIAGVDFSINKKTTATTLCPATSIPYLQNFESAVVPGMPTCTSIQDVNGNSGSFWLGTGGGGWETYTDGNPLTYVSPSNALLYFYDPNNLARGGDDWFYTQGLNLTGGTSYRLKFFYKALDGANFPEGMEVRYGTRAYSADMTNGPIFINNNITSVYASPYDSVRVDFTPPTTGVYYLGFHATSAGDEFGILVDDISVKISPVMDVGISGITVPSLNCPTNNVFVQATVTNFNTTTLNFATYPVTVTANITGAGTGTLTTLLNTGTLAPGASMNVFLSPSFNFSTGGLYNMTVTTSTTPASNDPETGNDSYSTSILVNSNPPAPVITPASPSVCAGVPVQLNTQFAPPAPPVVLPPFTSGTISIPVPDGSSAGATHTLAVSGIPANANIVSVSVTINMNHTWVGDMIFNLKAPNGRILNLDKYLGGTDAPGVNFVNTVISSPPAPPTPNYPALGSGVAPRTGTFRPDLINNAVAGFGIQNPNGYTSDAAAYSDLYSVPNGNWTLAMADGVGFDVGTLTSWSINITYQILTPTITWTPVS